MTNPDKMSATLVIPSLSRNLFVSRETFVEFVIRFFAIAQNDSATLPVTRSLSKGLFVSRETFFVKHI